MTPALVDSASIAMKVRVAFLGDLLRCPPARAWLWSLYYVGEAYVALHPEGLFAANLPSRLAKQLGRHLADETRHAAIFCELLGGTAPLPVPEDQDVGWCCLNHAVPDVLARARRGEPFDRRKTMRYMAFLHALELRSTTDLVALRTAASAQGDGVVIAALDRILPDEHYHAAYTHTAVFRHARDPAEARAVLREVLQAERTAYRAVSARIFHHFEGLGARPRSLAGRARWGALALAVATGAASPRLPLFDPLPRQVVA